MRLQFAANGLINRGRCVYRRADLTLCYEAEPWSVRARTPANLAEGLDDQFGRGQERRFFLIADTLTLVFETFGLYLTSLDAYTNAAMWSLAAQVEPPAFAARGSLQLTDVPEELERHRLRARPRYEKGPDWVRIDLGADGETTHYEVAKDLLIGLDRGDIRDIYMLNLHLA